MSYADPRLIDLYDGDNPDGPDHDFYRSLAAGIPDARILDLGCGTGILTVTFDAPGRAVVGVDPSAAMLAYARRRPGGDAVTWVLGDSSAAPAGPFDLAVMTGNVAQHIPEADWMRTLHDLRARLRPGGILAFESRNPIARAWESWTVTTPERRDSAHGQIDEWSTAVPIDPGVELTAHTRFLQSGDTVTEVLVLAFRSRERITADLVAAGFTVDHVAGDWHGAPFTGAEPLMIFTARAD